MSLILAAKVSVVRLMLNYNDYMERRTGPVPPTPNYIEQAPSTSERGHVNLEIFIPSEYKTAENGASHPVVVVLHGGGYSSGRSSMDYRFIGELLVSSIKPVIVAVDYSLAPEYHFPNAILDVIASLQWLTNEGATAYNLDPSRVVVSGFSAGGGISLTASMWMHEHIKHGTMTSLPHPLRGIVAIYPGIDSRPERTPSTSGLTNFLYSVWDAAYFSQAPKESPFVSPAAADDTLLKAGLPMRVGLYPVAMDPYVKPTEEFHQRLEALGKQVSGYTEPDEVHAWDKYPINPQSPRWQKRQQWFSKISADIESMLRV